MDIHILAFILLVCRIVSVIFMGSVLLKQFKLFGTDESRDVVIFRRVLFILALIIFLGQFVPILIDIATLVANAKRTNPNILGVAYGLSNAFTALLSSIAFWLVYRIAGRGIK